MADVKSPGMVVDLTPLPSPAVDSNAQNQDGCQVIAQLLDLVTEHHANCDKCSGSSTTPVPKGPQGHGHPNCSMNPCMGMCMNFCHFGGHGKGFGGHHFGKWGKKWHHGHGHHGHHSSDSSSDDEEDKKSQADKEGKDESPRDPKEAPVKGQGHHHMGPKWAPYCGRKMKCQKKMMKKMHKIHKQ